MSEVAVVENDASVVAPEKDYPKPYEIEEINVQDQVVTVVLSRFELEKISHALRNGIQAKTVNSLGGKLAKIRHIFLGNEELSTCLDMANVVVDANGETLKDVYQ